MLLTECGRSWVQDVSRARGKGWIEHALYQSAMLVSWNFGAMKLMKLRAVFLLLSPCMPQSMLVSEQKRATMPPFSNWSFSQDGQHLHYSDDDGSHLYSHLSCLSFTLLSLPFDVLLKSTFYLCHFGVCWFTSSQTCQPIK